MPDAFSAGAWSGSELLIWGGFDHGELTNAGAGYDTTADKWSAIHGTDPPSAREGHIAAWAASRLVVWGGAGPDPYAPVWPRGGIYDPQTDAWTVASAADASLECLQCAVVSTGAHIVLWGGFGLDPAADGPGAIRGAMFDPIANEWTPIAGPDFAVGERYASALWTGALLLIWGGTVDSLPASSGGVYHPASGAWSAMSVQGAPEARREHCAVWAGSRMFVWGGRPQAEGSPDPLATGGLYDPEANAWETTSEDGAPVPRFQHHCLWTGTHVIVIGGANVEHATTGGLYDPESAAWTSMSAEGLPVDDAPAPYMRDFFVPFHLGWDGCRVVMWGAYASEWQAWAYYPPPEIRAAAIPEQAAKPQP